MKRFWKKTEGFTLVELVVVIAILGILAGVGTVGYSGYVKKANIAADEQLMSSIRNAVTLAMFEAGNDFEGGAVKVSHGADAAVVEANDADKVLLEEAMVRAFGEAWKTTCKLSYADWAKESGNANNIKNSNVGKYMNEILDSVDEIAVDLESFMSSRDVSGLPQEIQDIIKKDTASNTEKTNAAMLAVGKAVSVATAAQQQAISEAMLNLAGGARSDGGSGYKFATGAYDNLEKAYLEIYKTEANPAGNEKMAMLSAAASMYAFAETYNQYAKANGDTSVQTRLDQMSFEGKDAAGVLGEIQGAVAEIAAKAQVSGNTIGNTYLTMAANDTTAFMSAMTAIGQSSDVLSNKLNQKVFQDGTAAKLATGYLTAGTVVTENGQAAVMVDGNQNITMYLGSIRE